MAGTPGLPLMVPSGRDIQGKHPSVAPLSPLPRARGAGGGVAQTVNQFGWFRGWFLC